MAKIHRLEKVMQVTGHTVLFCSTCGYSIEFAPGQAKPKKLNQGDPYAQHVFGAFDIHADVSTGDTPVPGTH